jgi:hypothetical protein
VIQTKTNIFRLPDKIKMDFRIALLKNAIDTQHTCEAFAEALIAYTNGVKQPDAMKSIIKRAQTLIHGV